MKKLFLLDAYALMYRAYFAFIKNPFFNSKGLNTSAMFGFVNTLEQVLAKEQPTHVGIAFDVHAPTFRHEQYPEYKATREVMPEDLQKAVPWLRRIVEAYRIPTFELAGYEADDIIGTLAKRAENEGFQVFMMTPDKDYAQLVSENIKIYKPGRSGADDEIWGVDEVCRNFGIERPEQVIDILGLMGDASDNVPGCPGVGPKSAQTLIGKYHSIDNMYAHINELKGKQKENLVNYEAQVRMSRQLVTIVLDAPIEFDAAAMEFGNPDSDALSRIFKELEFRSLQQKYDSMAPNTAAAASPQQMSLFGQGLLFAPDAVETSSAAAIPQPDSAATVEHLYLVAENAMQRASLRADLAVQKEFCFDTETTSLNVSEAELVCLSFSFRKGEAYCVPVPASREEAQKIVEEFRLVFEDENITKVGQNIKYDMLVLLRYGIEVRGALYDTMIAHYLIQPDHRHNLDDLCETYLNYRKIPTESLIGSKGKNQLSMRRVPLAQLKEYACEDADMTLQLKQTLDTGLDSHGVRQVFTDIEMPLIPVLADMERTGVRLNSCELAVYAQTLREQIIDCETAICQMAGESFNIGSPKQLGIILFEKLKIDHAVKKTKTQQYSTSEEVLSKLTNKHPIVGKILEYRGLLKLLNTYAEALPLMVDAHDRLHTSFNQTGTVTGRLSSSNPNLQNIPIRDESGREIRKAFIASDNEHTFISADYSQIELRIMAALSKDGQMLQAFHEGQDIHAITASKIYKVPVEDVTGDMRRKAKTANFGIIYGISAFGLSDRLNITRTEAKALIDSYFASFPKVKEYMDESIRTARNKGYVETVMGRRRYLPDINSSNGNIRGMAERNAINAPIQGSAADLIKIAMIRIYKALHRENLHTKMVLQVHDELNFDAPLNELARVTDIVRREMEGALNIGVPLLVEINSAPNWLDAH
ncbi:MAG: DNA polymerase I [Bacteroidales bacterium]|jgi:DNA polymerase-1|nr:DNA polymerase I [Bacteroidales bacterium]